MNILGVIEMNIKHRLERLERRFPKPIKFPPLKVEFVSDDENGNMIITETQYFEIGGVYGK